MKRFSAVITTVDLQEPEAEISAHAALALRSLVEIIDDPKAKARVRLEAVQRLKQYLIWLNCLVAARHTAPKVRQEIIDVLRRYRQSVF